MIITALRFKNLVDNQLKVWRIEPGKGNFKNILCFNGHEQYLEDIKTAIVFALTGKKNPRIVEAAIQLSDAAGDVWVIDRNQEKTRIFRNNKQLTQDSSQMALLSAMLDLDFLGDGANGAQNENIVDMYNLDFGAQGLQAHAQEKDTFSRVKVQGYVHLQGQKLKKQMSECMELPLLAEYANLPELVTRLEPLYLANLELNRQKKSLLSNLKNFSSFDPASIETLAAEISILSEIEQAAKPLLNPGHSPKTLREKLDKVEQELNAGLRACNLNALPVGQDDIAWQQLATLLAKITIYVKLDDAASKACTFIQNSIEPIYHSYVQVVEKFLGSDKEITQELETCLATLHLQLQLSMQKQQGRNRALRILTKFIRPGAAKREKEQAAEINNEKNILDHSKLAIDYILSRLGELHSSLKVNHATSMTSLEKLKEPEAKIKAELAALRERWQTTAEAQSIPLDMDINHLLKLISQYAHLSTLRNEKHRLQQLLAERQSHLHRLETALMDWRKTSGSQKTQEINTQPLLIAEAQGILRYKKMKEEQYQRLKAEMENSKAYQAIRINIENRSAEITGAWNKALRDADLPMLSIHLENWPKCFTLCKTLAMLNEFKDAEHKPLQGQDMFSGSNLAAPFNIFHWPMTPLKANDQLTFLSMLQNHDLSNFLVLLISDAGLYAHLQQSQVGYAKPWSKKPAPSPSLTTAKMKSPKPLMHEGAKAALEILNSKPSA